MRKLLFIKLAALLILSCSKDDRKILDTTPKNFSFNFNSDLEGWNAEFADYPKNNEDIYNLEFTHSNLPSPLDQNQKSIKQSGNNHSDDLFMCIKKKITGLIPNQKYSIKFSIEFASNAAEGSVGVGGSPGNSVFLKAGASTIEPIKIEQKDGYYRINIDKSNQGNSGKDMIKIGDFSNQTTKSIYNLVNIENSNFTTTTNSKGEIWVVIGTDSGFESTTTIYYNKIDLKFTAE